MDKFRDYRFICFLLLGGILFFGYEGMAEKYKIQMQEVWEETVDNMEMGDPLSYNGFGGAETAEGEKAGREENGSVSSNDPLDPEYSENEDTVSGNGNDETPCMELCGRG